METLEETRVFRKLGIEARNSFVNFMFSGIGERNYNRKRVDLSWKGFFNVLTVSRGFLMNGLANRYLILKVARPARYVSRPHFLTDIVQSDKQITNLKLDILELKTLLTIKPLFWVEVYGMPPLFLLYDFQCRSMEINPSYMRFRHFVEECTLISLMDDEFVPPAPAIFNQRGPVIPFFYCEIFAAFPRECEIFVFLPKLFLNDKFKECRDASFNILAFDKDGEARPLMSMKQNADSENSIIDSYGDDERFKDVERCEGLTFGLFPKFEDPKTKLKYSYAFKLEEDSVRLLMIVKCNARGTDLVNRIIQTARLYYAILAEMPSLKSFDIAVVISMSREIQQDAHPFVFQATIATEISDESNRTVQSIDDLRAERPDLQWFTDLCAPLASYRAYSVNFHPMKRNLWIVDSDPSVIEEM